MKDELLDQFMPVFDVREHHSVRIAAPAGVVLATAARMDLEDSWIIRLILRTREFVLGSREKRQDRPRGLLASMSSLGWGLLAETPGREIVMGSITQPWFADVVFRAVPAPEFATQCEPDHVKIAWTLRADPTPEDGGRSSTFHTETRVIACDEGARQKFRSYWRKFSPGIKIIRYAMLGPLKQAAERATAPPPR